MTCLCKLCVLASASRIAERIGVHLSSTNTELGVHCPETKCIQTLPTSCRSLAVYNARLACIHCTLPATQEPVKLPPFLRRRLSQMSFWGCQRLSSGTPWPCSRAWRSEGSSWRTRTSPLNTIWPCSSRVSSAPRRSIDGEQAWPRWTVMCSLPMLASRCTRGGAVMGTWMDAWGEMQPCSTMASSSLRKSNGGVCSTCLGALPIIRQVLQMCKAQLEGLSLHPMYSAVRKMGRPLLPCLKGQTCPLREMGQDAPAIWLIAPLSCWAHRPAGVRRR